MWLKRIEWITEYLDNSGRNCDDVVRMLNSDTRCQSIELTLVGNISHFPHAIKSNKSLKCVHVAPQTVL